MFRPSRRQMVSLSLIQTLFRGTRPNCLTLVKQSRRHIQMLDEPRYNARRMRMRRVFRSLLFTAVLASGLAGCGPSNDEALDVTVIGSAAPALADPDAGPLTAP